MQVVCKSLKAHNQNKLRGFCNLRLVDLGIEINDCPIYHTDRGRWVGLPSRAYETERGGRQFAPVVAFVDKSIYEEFQVAALAAVDAYAPPAPGRAA